MSSRQRHHMFQSGMSPVTTQVVVATPSSGSLSTSFQLTTTAASGTYPFSIGMGFTKGDATGSITTDLANAQVIVKRLWNDGSIKHAIISGRASLTQNVAKTVNLSAGTQSGGTAMTSSNIQAAAPSASVQCGAFGTVNLSTLLTSPVRTWVSGSEMVECHYRADVGGGSLLSVWFHVRLFADGRKWVRAVVENGYLDDGAGAAAANADRSYVPTLTIGGVTVYNNGGAALSHYKNTRYSAEAWIGGDPQITPKHDVTYLRASKLLPNYHWTSPSAAALNALTQTYTPMGRGDLEASMGAAGFQQSLGLIPMWDALYATSGDARAYRACLANSSHMNSYGIVWRDKSTNLAPKPSSFATWSLDGAGGGGTYDVVRGAMSWELNHMPGEAYLAYLATGDYWHYETLLFHLALCYLALSSGSGRGDGTSRLLLGETRGTSWCLRNMSQLSGIYPAGDAVGDDYQTLLSKNIDHWKAVVDTLGGAGIGYLWEYSLLIYDVANPGVIAPWQQHFGIQSLGMGSDLEPLLDMTNYNIVRDWEYRAPVGILGDSSGFCFTKASSFNIRITGVDNLDPATWYATWGQVYSASFSLGLLSGVSACTANVLEGASGGDPAVGDIGYWGNLMPAIAYAVDHGASGAQTSWNRLVGASNWPTLRDSGFDNIPNWGIAPRNWSDSSVLPAWRVGMAVGEWKEITGSSLSLAAVYNYGASNAPQGKQNAWVGWSIDTRTSKVYSVANGGHDDYWGNEVDVVNLEADSPAWGELLTSSSQADVNRPSDSDHYLDGRPASRHSYTTQQFIEAINRAMTFGVGSHSTSGNPGVSVDGFNITNSTFDAALTYTSVPFTVSGGGWAVAKHPTTEDVYCWNTNQGVYKWTQATGAWSQVNVGFLPGDATSAAAALDPTRGASGRILLVGGNVGMHHIFDIATGAISAITLTGALAGNIVGGHMGLVYESSLDVFLFRDGAAGGTIYSIDPATWAVSAFSTTGGTLVPEAALVSGGGHSVNTRWLYAPRLSGVVYGPAWGQNLWFLRTH